MSLYDIECECIHECDPERMSAWDCLFVFMRSFKKEYWTLFGTYKANFVPRGTKNYWTEKHEIPYHSLCNDISVIKMMKSLPVIISKCNEKLTWASTRCGSMCCWNIGNTVIIISFWDMKHPTRLLSLWTREIRCEWTPPTCFMTCNYFRAGNSTKKVSGLESEWDW